MNDRRMRVPGPDHPITIAPNPNRVVVTLGGHTLADSTRALTLSEASYAPVHYIPRDDVDITLLEPSAHATYCPYKGDASYFSIRAGAQSVDNAVWCYEAPYEAVAAIKGHLAFYRKHVDAIGERPA